MSTFRTSLALVALTAVVAGCPASDLPDLPSGAIESTDGLYAVTMKHAIEPPVAGDVQMAITLQERESLDGVAGATLGLTPWMPSMDHGIPDAPVISDDGAGDYTATWNYLMPGEWELTLDIDSEFGSDTVVATYEVEEAEAEPDPTEELTLHETITSGDYTLEVYSPAADLMVGLNDVTYKITDGMGMPVSGLTVTHEPFMDMTEGHDHACPYGEPVESTETAGLYESQIIYLMPGGMMGSWSQTITAVDGDSNETVFTIDDLSVVDQLGVKKMLDVGDPAVKWLFTLNFDGPLATGDNPYTLTVHKKMEMGMSWPGVEDLDITVTPWMPMMDHGSEGNVDPTLAASAIGGTYQGSVNLSMSGAWTFTADVVQGDTTIGQLVWDLSL